MLIKNKSPIIISILLLIIVLRSFISRISFGIIDFYVVSVIILAGLIIYGFNNFLNNNYYLKKIIILNIFFVGLYSLISILNQGFNVGHISRLLILGLSPTFIFTLINLKYHILQKCIIIMSLVLSTSVIFDFLALNNFLEKYGYDFIMNSYSYMRPKYDMYEHGLTKSLIFYRPLGSLGIIPHNSALANAMFSVYWLFIAVTSNEDRLFYIVLFSLSAIALFFSIVSSTIVAMFLTLILFTILIYRSIRLDKIKVMFLLFLLFLLFFILYSFAYIPESIYLRLSHSTGDWKNILDFRRGDSLDDLASFFFGNYIYFGSRMGSVEITLVALIFQLSIFGFIILMAYLLYPCIIFLKEIRFTAKLYKLVPEVAAIFLGVISLWHYASLLDMENFMIFNIFYACFLIKFSNSCELGGKDMVRD